MRSPIRQMLGARGYNLFFMVFLFIFAVFFAFFIDYTYTLKLWGVPILRVMIPLLFLWFWWEKKNGNL